MVQFSKRLTVGLLAVAVCVATSAAVVVAKTNVQFQSPSYSMAKKAKSFIRFAMVHRRLGVSSTFDGYVKAFDVQGDYTGKTFDHGQVSFAVVAMDTNNKSRNGHMQEDSLKAKANPDVVVTFSKPLHEGSQQVPGTIQILGQPHPVTVQVDIKPQGTDYVATGNANLSLKALGVTVPTFISDKVASVDDKVGVTYSVLMTKTQLASL